MIQSKNSGEMNKTCANAARRLRVLIDEANTIVNGESPRRGVAPFSASAD